MELRQKKKRNEGLGFKGGDAVELDRYIARAESAAAQAAESAAAAAAQLGQVGMNADAIAALRRDVDSIGEELPGKYTIPVEGIPETDLSADVRASLGRADTALQPDALSAYRTAAAQDEIDGGKQAKLVSGENIKTVNGQTILGAGDLVIQYSRPNLLDNWYFVGGGSQLGDGVFPINQRGQTSYSNTGYGIDRVRLANGGATLHVENDGIRFSGNTSEITNYGYINFFGQDIPSGYTATYSVLTDKGLYSVRTGSSTITLPSGILLYIVSGMLSLRVPGNLAKADSELFIAAKVEIGGYQTLAHPEDDGNGGTNWVLNEGPDFGEELRKCRRYFRVFESSPGNGVGQYFLAVRGFSNKRYLNIPLEEPMAGAIIPSLPDGIQGAAVDGTGTQAALASVSTANSNKSFGINVSSDLALTPISVYLNNRIYLSAE